MNAATGFNVRQLGPAAIVDLKGDLSHESESPLLAAIRDPLVVNHDIVILNFKGTGYINSAGICLMVSLIAQNRDTKRKLMACSLSPHYQKIFRMVGLTPFLPIYENEAAAISAVSISAEDPNAT